MTPQGVTPGTIHVRHEKIEAVRGYDDLPAGAAVEDAGELAVLPGIVDTHVHINEPGRTEWEGFESATRAAAAGGVTTLIEMPLNSIPATTSASALREKCHAARGKLFVDTGFWGGVVPDNAANAAALRSLYEAGAFGFKCFLVPSGVDEFPCVTERDLRAALPTLVRLGGAPLLVHAELPGPIETALATTVGKDPRKYATWLKSRPRDAENSAISLMIRLAREFKAPVHIVHLSSAEALSALGAAKKEGLPITVETCPHYLYWKSEDIADAATEFKCAPPIRDEMNRKLLWNSLGGVIDLVASDHSPCPPAMKGAESGDFLRAWGGIASLELGLSVMWTLLCEQGWKAVGLPYLARWMSAGPARLAGLEGRKGAIAPGCDADFVVFDPHAAFRVQAEKLHHRHKVTPYAGRELRGAVRATWLRGKKVYDGEAFPAGACGEILLRGFS